MRDQRLPDIGLIRRRILYLRHMQPQTRLDVNL